ncbi:MAG TPA: EamA family transporter [Candidatus Competibacteraceae bacterium]|nr:EamA family transporter [Candidatus Competibacteraceae bacterium]
MVHGLYASVVLIWGLTWIAIKLQLGLVPAPVSIAYRFAIAAVVLFAWLLATGRLQRLQAADHGFCLLQGLCLFCLNFLCFYNATAYIPSGVVAVVFSTATLWNAFNGRLFLGTAITARVLGGAGLGLLGIGALFWPELRGQGAGADTLYGLALALAGTYNFSLGNMISAHQQRRGLRPLTSNAWGMLYGTGLLLLYVLAAGIPLRFDPAPGYVLALLYLAIPGSVIGFTAYLTLVGRIGPDKAAYATVLFPVVALNVSAWVEGYQWSPLALAGLAAVLAGNVLVFRRPATARADSSSSVRERVGVRA